MKKMISRHTAAMKGPRGLSNAPWGAEEPYGKIAGNNHRALEILELFAIEQTPLSVGEVSKKLGFPQSSTSLLLHGMAGRGYLLYDRVRRLFFPTVRVIFLGMWLQDRISHRGNLLEFMETLARKSGHVALLAVQNGLHAQYMHIVSRRQSRIGVKPGLLRPICRAAVGKILLSTKADDEIRRIVRAVNASNAVQEASVNAKALLAEIEECRKTGFAFSMDGVTAGASVIATLLPVTVAASPIAIGVGVHTSEFNALRPKMMDLLRKTIAEFFHSAPTAGAI